MILQENATYMAARVLLPCAFAWPVTDLDLGSDAYGSARGTVRLTGRWLQGAIYMWDEDRIPATHATDFPLQ